MAEPQIQQEPIFVVGGQRSGTTMLRLMLNSHPHIAIPFESDFIPRFYRRVADYGDLSRKENVTRLLDDIAEQPFVKRGKLVFDEAAILARHPRSYPELIKAIYQVYAESEGKRRWGDKDPDYVTELDVLWKLFPGCRIVHIVRDGRDVAISLRELDWGSKNLIKLARDWSWQVTLGHKMGVMLGPEYYMEIRYEDLVLEPERTLRRICAFIGEPYFPKMLSYHETAAAAMPADSLKYHGTSVRPPDTDKVQAWRRRMSAADRILFEEVAGRTLREFGYELEGLRNTWASRLRRLHYSLFSRW